jgi:hypothetical protein
MHVNSIISVSRHQGGGAGAMVLKRKEERRHKEKGEKIKSEKKRKKGGCGVASIWLRLVRRIPAMVEVVVGRALFFPTNLGLRGCAGVGVVGASAIVLLLSAFVVWSAIVRPSEVERCQHGSDQRRRKAVFCLKAFFFCFSPLSGAVAPPFPPPPFFCIAMRVKVCCARE